MRLQKKSLSKVSLTDLLRRKRTNLSNFLTETGIVTYDLLLKRCDSIGVLPPTEDQFLKVKGYPVTHEVSSPTEGIVVLNSIDASVNDPEDERLQNLKTDFDDSAASENHSSQKSKRRKKREEDSSNHQ